jgi:hypothetical protein
LANVLAGSVNFYLGSGGYDGIRDMKIKNELMWSLIFIPFYIITELAPSVMFAIVMDKYREE